MKGNPQNSQLPALFTAIFEDLSVIQKTLRAGSLTLNRQTTSTYIASYSIWTDSYPPISSNFAYRQIPVHLYR
jgi:hypothetical protein